tara:strand:- start:159 stop:491 length:333 start_codon:yes stop_codon:yes gene_type:complete
VTDRLYHRLEALHNDEGLAIAGLEAMACGVPIVSTRCGGPEDYVRKAQNGILCKFNADDIAKAIKSILHDGSLRQTLAVSARQTVENECNFPCFKNNLTTAWQETWDEKL